MKDAFYKFAFRPKFLEYEYKGNKYVVEYHRSPFWTYEKRSLLRFLKDKLMSWHAMVWLVFPNGGKSGHDAVFVEKLFPRRFMKRFLRRSASRIHYVCYERKGDDE